MENASVFPDGGDEGGGLEDGVGEGFFAVDVLAGGGGGHGDEGVPVVGRGDDDGIDVRARQEFAEIVVDGAALEFGAGLSGVVLLHDAPVVLAPGGVHIADRNDPGVGELEEAVHEAPGLDSAPDEPEPDGVVGADGSGPDAGGQEEWGDAGGQCGLEEGASLDGGGGHGGDGIRARCPGTIPKQAGELRAAPRWRCGRLQAKSWGTTRPATSVRR